MLVLEWSLQTSESNHQDLSWSIPGIFPLRVLAGVGWNVLSVDNMCMASFFTALHC